MSCVWVYYAMTVKRPHWAIKPWTAFNIKDLTLIDMCGSLVLQWQNQLCSDQTDPMFAAAKIVENLQKSANYATGTLCTFARLTSNHSLAAAENNYTNLQTRGLTQFCRHKSWFGRWGDKTTYRVWKQRAKKGQLPRIQIGIDCQRMLSIAEDVGMERVAGLWNSRVVVREL